MDAKNYTKTYKDNQMMSLELKNMYIIMEENKDLQMIMNRVQVQGLQLVLSQY